LDFSASYADFAYATNTRGLCYPGRAPDSPTDPRSCDLSGERPINAPLRKTHVGLAYTNPVSFGEVFARLDWSATSDYNTSFSADPRLKQPAYDWINVRAGLDWGRYALTFWAENLTDETVVSFDSVLNIYAVDNSHEGYLQAPRSFGVSFRADFR
jgi:outer membrane receptor protein involved in Fe transport